MLGQSYGGIQAYYLNQSEASDSATPYDRRLGDLSGSSIHTDNLITISNKPQAEKSATVEINKK